MVHFDYTDKVALVTGGTSGIGKATALAFAQAGAQVVIAARNQEKGQNVADELTEAAPAGVVQFIAADMASAGAIRHLFDEVIARHGHLDIVINNAADEGGIGKPLHQFDEAEFDRTVAVNYKAVWLCMKCAVEQMVKQPAGGAIVNVSSVNGLGGVAGGSLYAATKAAVLALTKSAALEYGRSTIKVNALVPGFFDTPLLQKAIVTQTDGSPDGIASLRHQISEAIPLGQIASPEQAANAILWLCSPQTPYLIGHSMIMDGGLSALYR